MSLIAYDSNPPETSVDAVSNAGFWPDIKPSHFRDAERIDSSITDVRVNLALQTAMADINRQLADWQQRQQDDGADKIEDVVPPKWLPADSYSALYLRAVYATATASLLERYRNHSATADGDERGEAKDMVADDYRRDARWAVAEIEGHTHTTVELI